MDDTQKLLMKQLEERELITQGLKAVKARQTILSAIGVLILIMFTVTFFQTRAQIKKENEIIQRLNDVVHAGRLLIKSQDELIDSLTLYDSLPQK